jgi:hypothetical protein
VDRLWLGVEELAVLAEALWSRGAGACVAVRDRVCVGAPWAGVSGAGVVFSSDGARVCFRAYDVVERALVLACLVLDGLLCVHVRFTSIVVGSFEPRTGWFQRND